MYKRLTVADSVRVPPEHFGENVEESVKEGLKEEAEGTITEEAGVILAVENVLSVEGGDIEPEDAGVHYEVEYEALTFAPEMHEVIRGEVVDITDFGAFIRIGPFDGLCHVSQVMDEYVNMDEENNMLVSEEEQFSLEIDDKVITRIIAVSLGNEESNKINLTMRQPGLGKDEWIEHYEEEKAEEEQEEEEGEE
ncbi:MAG: DNA-directed RNA polymerase subunit E' [Candidatus Nanohaloarchaea archaeon]|jgi:DNA-directed RNA polymerase subunit E'